MKRIIIGFALLMFVVFLCSRVSAQEGPHLIFNEDTESITVSTYTNTNTFNITDNITIQSDLSVLPLEGNILDIQITITKPETEDYFIYELKDPENKLTSIIDRITFNMPPMAIKDGELAWRVAGKTTELFITGTVAPAPPIYNESSGLWENNTMSITSGDFEQLSRKPKITERVSLGIKDRIDILRSTVGWKQITIFALVAGLLLFLLRWYYRKRNVLHDKLITKQLEKHESL
ncbi:hypothetical protein KY346_04655 [Candidatus Woesearchaeota archaeon]|nr:hypothetical protein [Candidatus Woesearchaeota archaeon]